MLPDVFCSLDLQVQGPSYCAALKGVADRNSKWAPLALANDLQGDA